MKKQNNKKNMMIAIAVLGIVSVTPSIVSAMGPGGGNSGRMGQNMMNEDGVPIGLQDDDGDGIINRDDEDFEKPMLNARDNDEDGVPNRLDEDYAPAKDGTGRPDDVPQGAGQMKQMNSGAQQRMNTPAQAKQAQETKNQVRQNVRNRAMETNGGNSQMRTQLRTMTQDREQIQQEIADDVAELQKQSKIKKMFVGANSEIVKDAQNKLNAYEQKINTLEQMSENATNPEDKAAIEAQIQQMQTMHAQMEDLVAQNSEGFSLFDWMKSLFN